jgi:acyl-CoA synthetase (NDP forming)
MTSAASLRALLDPRAIAVVGASADPSRTGGRPIRYLQQLGFAGAIYPVNPGRSEIAGLRCYPNLAALPDGVDLAVITVPAAQVEQALQDCADASIRAAVVFTSGFAEVGDAGRAQQERLAAIARAHDIALCGPNCLGLINVAKRSAPTFTTALERRPDIPYGPIGFISQSGAIAAFILARMQDQGYGLSHFITTGNEATLGFADFAEYLLDDPAVGVIAGYLEGIDGASLARVAAAALRHKKPLVVMKVGASAAGTRATVAHTGKLGGNDAVYAAAFRQWGMLRAENVDDLLDWSQTLAHAPLPAGRRVGIVSLSGGAAVLMADWCEQLGLPLAPLAPTTRERLAAAMPWFATPANPMDTTGRPLWDEGLMQAAVGAIAEDPGVDIMLVYIGLAPGPGRRIAAEVLAGMAGAAGKPLLVCWLAENDAAVPLFTEPVRMTRAAAALAEYAEALRRPPPSAPPPAPTLPALPAGAVIGEHAAKRWLAAGGIEGPRETLVATADEAAAWAAAQGYPVALKIVSPDVPHRTDIGAVRLGLRNESDLRAAWEAIRAATRAAVPTARIDGMLVQEMVAGGVELVVSAFRDAAFGPVVLCGLGGVLVEVLNDTALRLAPVGEDEALAMLASLRGAAILRGVRGAPACDLPAAAQAIARLSAIIAAAGPDIDTIEINPLAVLPAGRGVRALDALITRRPAEAS